MGIATIPVTDRPTLRPVGGPAPHALHGTSLPLAVARHLLGLHADRLPDLSGLTVLVPNHRAGQDFARALAQSAGLAALIPPHIVPLKSWADGVADSHGESQTWRLARLHGVLRRVDWLGKIDKWTLANELLSLVDALSAARLGGEIGSQVRALHTDALDRETALIEAVWQALNTGGQDPQARYAAALDKLLGQIASAPRPLYGYALGTLTAVEQQFLKRCSEYTTLTQFELGCERTAAHAVTHTLHQAWQRTDPPVLTRASELASAYTDSPLLGRFTLNPAPNLEGEARAVATWVAAQLQDGKRDIALIALDREAARRVRALLERMEVLVADETGWMLSTTAAAAVIDRWLECVASDFPHVELLDLLKSPFMLGDLASRQDQVLQLELALRRQGVAQGMADIRRLAHMLFGALPGWLDALFNARQGFAQSRAPLAIWLTRLLDSFGPLGVTLKADAAGAKVLDTLDALRHDLIDDREQYSFGEWRRWLNLALESASFIDTRVTSPLVLTSLPAARGRVFEAVAIIGADARHLPVYPAPGLFSQPVRAQLGLPTAAVAAAEATTDLIQLLSQGAALLSWQAWHDDEPNPASPLVLRLQALHLSAWGSHLPEQVSAEMPVRPSSLPQACERAAPMVLPEYLPRRYAPTAYQTLLDCPYRFFVKSVLGIRELDEADEALDKSDYGNALHRILKVFHDSQPPGERGAALACLSAVSAAEFASLPAYTATVWGRRWATIQPAYIDAWLDGMGQGWHYLSGERLFEMQYEVAGLGDITLHGRIDRVDRRIDSSGDEVLGVIDYKTSAAQGLKKKLKNPAEAVQLPFYAWLAEAAAAYLPIDETPVATLELDGETDVDAICRRLPALLGAMAAGAALPATGVDAVCQHCEARGLCRKGMCDAVDAGAPDA